MLQAAQGLLAMDETMREETTYVWVDYCSVPQCHPRTQELAINSLSIYSSCSSKFVVIAPSAKHEDTCQLCNFATYNRRTWCRLEQLAFCMNHDLSRMYIFEDEGHELKLMSLEQARESVQVFEGQLTCCRREHVGMKMCDREKLVGPILGLYGTAYAKHIRQKGVEADSSASFELIKDAVFPATIDFKQRSRAGKLASQKRVLFGTLRQDMEKFIDEREEQSDLRGAERSARSARSSALVPPSAPSPT